MPAGTKKHVRYFKILTLNLQYIHQIKMPTNNKPTDEKGIFNISRATPIPAIKNIKPTR